MRCSDRFHVSWDMSYPSALCDKKLLECRVDLTCCDRNMLGYWPPQVVLEQMSPIQCSMHDSRIVRLTNKKTLNFQKMIHVTDYARFFQLSRQSFQCPYLCLMQVLIFPSASNSVCRAGLVNAINNLHEGFHQRTFTTQHTCLIQAQNLRITTWVTRHRFGWQEGDWHKPRDSGRAQTWWVAHVLELTCICNTQHRKMKQIM